MLHDLTGAYVAGFAVSIACIGIACAAFWTVPQMRSFK